MTTLTIDLQPELYARLTQEAANAGRPIEKLIEESLARRFLPAAPAGERERAMAVLREAGLLVELEPELKHLASQASMSLEEIHAVFARTGGQSLSELVQEQRGAKG
ncbi:MAG: hypothetical protein EI684_03870 [Candidatus Viridilinea halotolerans]|uniref:Uncharacterized protein n=1 Tax=Candidatus Viridilinea halotolerans TaxID=2491704 RepID=A0A426U788_9CHLR|nr:MAG: hypothetical protein EI684_03870 [Candidatus Viridilinea halotolerans]